MSGSSDFELKHRDTGDPYKVDKVQEKEVLVNESLHVVDLEQALLLKKWAVIVSWISVIVSLSLGVLAFVVAGLQKSQALLAFGFESILDCLSSGVVVWRYQCTSSSGHIYSKKRDKVACIVLAVLFFISSVTIFGIALHALIYEYKPFKDDILWYISLANGTICIGMSSAKFYLGRKLESSAIITDGVNSLIGAVLSGAILSSSLVYTHITNSVWYIDSVIGMVCALVLAGYGMKLFFDHACEKESLDENTPVQGTTGTQY